MIESNTSLIKYPYGFIFKVKNVKKIKEETYFGRKIKTKELIHRDGTLFCGKKLVRKFDKFKDFSLDIFRFNENYYLLSKINGIFMLTNLDTLESRQINFNVSQFKTNGIDKLSIIIDKVLYLVTFKVNKNKILEFVVLDKYEKFKTVNGEYLGIDWSTSISFDTIFVESDTKILRSNIRNYNRHIVKITINKNKIVPFVTVLRKNSDLGD